jgi:hypothetical protein
MHPDRSPLTRRLAPAALAGLAVLGLAACSGGSTTSASATPSTTATTAAATSPSGATAPSGGATSAAPTQAPQGQVVAITVAGGKVTGPTGRVPVKQGTTVTLQVTSDVTDEVHLHGYDKHVDVPKGGTANLTFTADLTGVFEVELEQRSLPLVQLQVQ